MAGAAKVTAPWPNRNTAKVEQEQKKRRCASFLSMTHGHGLEKLERAGVAPLTGPRQCERNTAEMNKHSTARTWRSSIVAVAGCPGAYARIKNRNGARKTSNAAIVDTADRGTIPRDDTSCRNVKPIPRDAGDPRCEPQSAARRLHDACKDGQRVAHVDPVSAGPRQLTF